MADLTLYSLPPRFIAKVVIRDDGCWLWMGAATPEGYGYYWTGARHMPAHRFAYEALVGPIPEGLQLDHLCETPSCVNPDHLEPCTARENTLRSSRAPAALNARKTHCKRGHEFTPENTYIRQDNGARQCRQCKTNARRLLHRAEAEGRGASRPSNAEDPTPIKEKEACDAWPP